MNDTKRFIDLVFEPDDIVELRFIKSKSIKRQWHYARDLPKYFDQWQHLNNRGYNIFIGINPRKQFNESGDKNVLHSRFFFADFDKIEPGDGCGIWEFVSDRIFQAEIDLPDFEVFSGHGIHTYWKLSEPLKNLKSWRKIQTALIKMLDSDKAIKNPERIMRLPGFINVKSEPTDCFIVQ